MPPRAGTGGGLSVILRCFVLTATLAKAATALYDNASDTNVLVTQQPSPELEAALGRAALATLDRMSVPVVLMTVDCVVIHATPAALSLLKAGRAFNIRNEQLTVRRKADRLALKEALAQVVWTGSPVIMRLVNRQSDLNHVVIIAPSRSTNLISVSITELRVPLSLPPGWTRTILALPESQAQLAEALASGENLAEFAERVKLTPEGARTRLKKLLQQTATRSQADLVALLLRVAPIVLP